LPAQSATEKALRSNEELHLMRIPKPHVPCR
jgi:hypothetical protein